MTITLGDLCVRLGFCLPPLVIDAFKTDPPWGVDTFVDAVIRAEGLDPLHIDSQMRKTMCEIVELRMGGIFRSGQAPTAPGSDAPPIN